MTKKWLSICSKVTDQESGVTNFKYVLNYFLWPESVCIIYHFVVKALAKDIREFKSRTDGDTQMFYEIIASPSYREKGLEILHGKSNTLRILQAKKNSIGKLSLRQVAGGWLDQD